MNNLTSLDEKIMMNATEKPTRTQEGNVDNKTDDHNQDDPTNLYEYGDIHDDYNNGRNHISASDADDFLSTSSLSQQQQQQQQHNSSTRNDIMIMSGNSTSSRRRLNVVAVPSNTSIRLEGKSKRQNDTDYDNHNNSSNNHSSALSSSTGGGTVFYRPTQRVVWYNPPRQRQKWGDTQVLPRVNWFDLFFDLFYVGATYNVTSILYNTPTIRGLLYAAGTFLPVMNIWIDRTSYEGRYVMEDDLCHRLSIIFKFTIVGFTIANIRTVDILSDARNESSIFFFTLMLVIERIFASLLYVELYFFGVGQPQQIKSAAIRDCIHSNHSLPFYFAAMMIAALHYFGSSSSSSNNDNNSIKQRFLAETSSYESNDDETTTTDLPIALCLIGCVVKLLVFTFMIIFCLPGDGRHKEIAVPLNIDFVIHRNGEWMMLMLGESIFSLLIISDVPNKGLHFYLVFYFSLLTVILLQLLHFQSQPHEADLHAARRSKNRGMLWSLLQSVYSLSLVIMGASYTFFLLYADDTNERRLYMIPRQLAGTSSGDSNSSDRIGAAHLYSGALSIVFLSLNTMTVLHKSSEELQVQYCLKKEKQYTATLVVILRFGIVVVAATISQWTIQPTYITLSGLLCVVADLFCGKMESISLSNKSTQQQYTVDGGVSSPPKHVIEEVVEEEAEWPNVMHASVEVES